MQLRLRAAQLAKLAKLPMGSVAFYIAGGVLQPSVRRAGTKGQPHIFDFRDLVIARSIAQMRLPAVSAEGMQQMASFWRSDEGAALLNAISTEVDPNKDRNYQQTSVQRVFLLLSDGRLVVEGNRPILDMTRGYDSPIVHVIDAGLLVEQATIDVTEALMRLELIQPGPGGGVPRAKSQKPKREGRSATDPPAARRSEPTKKKSWGKK